MTSNEPFDMSEFSLSVVGMACTAKKLLCELERGPSDTPPMLVWHGTDEIYLMGMPMPDDDNPAYLVLAQALTAGFEEFGVPRFVSLIVEAYGISEQEKIDIQRGELQERFLQLDPTVQEVITVLTFDTKGECHSDMVYYKYNDAGQPVFDDPRHETISEGAGGSIIDVVKQFCAFCNLE